jgi:hypothetical protein
MLSCRLKSLAKAKSGIHMNEIEKSSGQRRNLRANALRAAGLMFAMAILGASTLARADDVTVGTVTQVSGNAQIVRAGSGIAAQPGTAVKVHDTVTTQPDASTTLGFGDGSSMALTGGTSIKIEDSAIVNGQTLPSRVTLMSGKVHTNVPDKTTGQQHTIEVDAAYQRVTGPAPNH